MTGSSDWRDRSPTTVAGIDGYGRGAWIAVVLASGTFARAAIGRTLSLLLPQLDDCSVLAIDIPIGLPDDGPRRADQLAAARLGPRRSSVFPTPPRAVLEAPSYVEAKEAALGVIGHMISQQSYAIRSRIFEAESVARVDRRLVEVHPEVSFATMAGATLSWSKMSWRGARLRRDLLGASGIVLPDEIGAGDVVPVDDVLDAAAAAWSAARIASGAAISMPDPPDVHTDGLPAAIWA